MFPPCVEEVAVEIACPLGGATPKQPTIGRIGSANRPSAVLGSTRVAVPASWSISHRAGASSGACFTLSGSSTLGAIALALHPNFRLGLSRSKVTESMSPGSAPSTKNGPVCGLPRSVTCFPVASIPRASTVVVITVLPEAMVRTGACVPMEVWYTRGSNRWTLIEGSLEWLAPGRTRSHLCALCRAPLEQKLAPPTINRRVADRDALDPRLGEVDLPRQRLQAQSLLPMRRPSFLLGGRGGLFGESPARGSQRATRSTRLDVPALVRTVPPVG